MHIQTAGQGLQPRLLVLHARRRSSQQQATWLAYDKKHGIDTSNGAVAPPPVIPKAAQQRAASMAIDDLYDPFAGEKVPEQVNPTLGTALAATGRHRPPPRPRRPPRSTVSIPTKHGKAAKGQAQVKLAAASTMTGTLPAPASPRRSSGVQPHRRLLSGAGAGSR